MVMRRRDITIERGVLPRSCFLVPSSYQQKGSRSMPSHFSATPNMLQFPDVTYRNRYHKLRVLRTATTLSI